MALVAVSKETKDEKVTRLEEEAVVASANQVITDIKSKIREFYSVDDEFKLMSLGIADKTDADYIAYREQIEAIKLEVRGE